MRCSTIFSFSLILNAYTILVGVVYEKVERVGLPLASIRDNTSVVCGYEGGVRVQDVA